jgi:tRNA pseudouridine13 synthase
MAPDPTPPSPPPILDPDTHATPRTFVTHDIPPIGGTIKQRPEDFLVDEIPAYEPCGQGEHIYLLVQKRNLSTLELVHILARHFNVPPSDVGYAGLKDKHAITRQVVSIRATGKKIEDFPMIQDERVSVLWSDYHTNKLRPGHLKGNRFSIRIRNVKLPDVLHAKRVLDRLERTGVPNRFASQRFGLLQNNHLIGRAMIVRDFPRVLDELLGPSAAFPSQNAEARALYALGRYAEAIPLYPRTARAETFALRMLARGEKPSKIVYAIDPIVGRFMISAFQSAIFNAVLDERLAVGTFNAILPGDIAFKHDNGSIFAIDDATFADPATHERAAKLEISPTGPMWQGRMMRAAGERDAAERRALERLGVTPAHIEDFTKKAPQLIEGSRRPLRVPLIDPDVEGGVDEHGAYVRVAFELPRGCFATAVLPEIMKNSAPPDSPAHDDEQETARE